MQPILKINLSTGETTEYEIQKNWEHDNLDGASLAARLLYPELPADLDPVSLESPLLFLNGPLSGWRGQEK
jgi:aldehyde:ferredoxin oxidoreductase